MRLRPLISAPQLGCDVDFSTKFLHSNSITNNHRLQSNLVQPSINHATKGSNPTKSYLKVSFLQDQRIHTYRKTNLPRALAYYSP